MRFQHLKVLFFLVLLVSVTPGVSADESPKANFSESQPSLERVINSSHRSQKNRDRDKYRHPLKTLQFLGLRPNMTVVELWPGAGWYTEILAPYLARKGQLIVSYDPKKNRDPQDFPPKLAVTPEIFSRVKVVLINPPDDFHLAPDNSVDMVVTFRNIHNWVKSGYDQKIYTAVYRALKPGGIFGVEEHRGKPNISLQESIKTGYMSENGVIAAIKKSGFKLVAKSEINANPRDTKDYPAGVWTLPPNLRQGDNNRDHYLAIGESDRMTLKFVKPDNQLHQ